MPSFRNWAGNQRATPEHLHRPASQQDVQAVVRRARDAGQTVRVVGAGHSWSDIVVTDQHLVSLDAMGQVLDVDAERSRVRVQAGMRLKDLVEHLADVGLALPNLGSIAEQSIAGATATGTHGSSVRHTNLSGLIVGARLVDGRGEVVDVGPDDPERLAAVRVSLGCLGVVTELTLQCEPAFDLEERTWVLPVAAAFDQVESLARNNEYVKLWWLPHTERVLVVTHRRTSAARAPQSKLSRWYEDGLERYLFTGLLGLGRLSAGLIGPINRMLAGSLFVERRRIDRSDRALTIAMPPKHREMEYALPLSDASAALAEILRWTADDGLRVNFPLEVRLVGPDDGLLSPAGGRETCQIGAYMAASRDLEAYFGGFQSRMQARGARPHWGKEFSATPAYLRSVYPGFEAFLAQRQTLDPEGVFVNDFVRRHLLGSE